MWIVLLAAASVALVTPWLALYWLHNRGGIRALRLPLHRWRQPSMRLGALAAIAAAVTLIWHGDWDLSATVLPLVGVVLLSTVYARLFQLLSPRPASLLVPADESDVGPGDHVAVLEEGGAVPLAWLALMHTARRREVVVVHGRAPRSLLAVYSADYKPIAAVLPHPGGFEIGAVGRLWDGVTGVALDKKSDLPRAPVGLCTHAAWRQAWPDAPLLGPAEGLPRLSFPEAVLVRLRSSAKDDNRWGKVADGRWVGLEDADLDVCSRPDGVAYYLGWRSARERGIPGA